MTRVNVLYFASLRDAAGVAQESLDTNASDLGELYAQLRERHGFAFRREHVRVAVDAEFAAWGDPPRDGSDIAFIPPVSGG